MKKISAISCFSVLLSGIYFGLFAWSDFGGTITKIQINNSLSDQYPNGQNNIVITTSDQRQSWIPLDNEFGKYVLAWALAAQTNVKPVSLHVAENQPLNASNPNCYRIYTVSNN